jgi:2-polyprenyl-6-methoxyphenol hydroxylase-like FAD-dependent oxidoreductase
MSPFAGNGANMALMDGIDLATELCMADSVASAILLFDAKSMPRSRRAIQQSHWSISLAHATGLKLAFWKIILRVVNLFFGN